MTMLVWAYGVAFLLGAYLIGSLSFAVLVSRALRLQDPRSYGSKNPGATNVLRSGNKFAAVLTLALDTLKGWLPVVLAQRFAPELGLGEWVVALTGLAAFAGHLWPVFFGFAGGKGVATAAGVVLAFEPWLGLATLATWIIIVVFFRYSSLASLVAAVFAPLYGLLGNSVAWVIDKPRLLVLVMMAMLLAWRHAENINRLIQGKESKIGKSK